MTVQFDLKEYKWKKTWREKLKRENRCSLCYKNKETSSVRCNKCNDIMTMYCLLRRLESRENNEF